MTEKQIASGDLIRVIANPRRSTVIEDRMYKVFKVFRTEVRADGDRIWTEGPSMYFYHDEVELVKPRVKLNLKKIKL